ncbi:MAG: diguanylate cyclase [Desulfuromonadaceae bacterium]|nr:diguanylate cyclase [Desulfuromonadaceae bacterium]
MRRLFQSIQGKIWLCVLVALVGYFIGSAVSASLHLFQYRRFSELESRFIPLVNGSDRLLGLFDQQSAEVESALLTGERDLLDHAGTLSSKVNVTLQQLGAVSEAYDDRLSLEELDALRKGYQDFCQLLEAIELGGDADHLIWEDHEKIQKLGRQQRQVRHQVEQLCERFHLDLVHQIEANKQRSVFGLTALAALFFSVLLCAALVSRWISVRLLVEPLGQVWRQVESFERELQGGDLSRRFSGDEIEQLSDAFHRMVTRLDRTMVSKRYVENIVNNMMEGLLVLNADLMVEKVNQRTVELLALPETEMIGQPASLLIQGAGKAETFTDRLSLVKEGGRVHSIEVLGRRGDGRLVPLSFSASAVLDDRGRSTQIVCVLYDLTRIKNIEEQLRQLAHHDPLTGLPNRNLFFERIEYALADGKRHGRIFALLYLDLDRFKPINDTCGHDIGDLALKEVARRLLDGVRADDTVARIGGDEFVILLSALPDYATAGTIADKVIQAIAPPLSLGSLTHELGVSIGISIFPRDGTSRDQLIDKADQAMYEAKKNGGNRWVESV